MNKLITFLVVIVLTSFTVVDKKTNNDFLASIDFGDTLRLVHMDEKCGEWGGDKEVIQIYRVSKTENVLFANYIKTVMNCEDPYNSTRRAEDVKHKGIKMTEENLKTAQDCIQELLINKLKRENVLAHSGIFNSVQLNDSSLIIKDYPSDNWSKFQLLRDSLLRK